MFENLKILIAKKSSKRGASERADGHTATPTALVTPVTLAIDSLNSSHQTEGILTPMASHRSLEVQAEAPPHPAADQADRADSPPGSGSHMYPDLGERYQLLEKIGDGAFAKVYRALDTTTNTIIAVKVIDKQTTSSSQLQGVLKEVSIMRTLKHPNIIKLLAFKNTPLHCFLMLELADGGEIFNQIIRLTYFLEDLARHVLVQVANAVKYLHEEIGVVHRDIKPENLLFSCIPAEAAVSTPHARASDDHTKLAEGRFRPGVGGGTIGTVKLADFGLSKVLWDRQTQTPCGTAGYTAPEIMNDLEYDKSVDVWSLGCVLYTLLCGFPPFYDTDQHVLAAKIVAGDYCFLSPWWDEISKEAKDLVTHLLTLDPTQRYTVDELLLHPWILQNNQNTTPARDAPTISSPAGGSPFGRDYFATPSLDHLVTTPRAEAIRFAFDMNHCTRKLASTSTSIINASSHFLLDRVVESFDNNHARIGDSTLGVSRHLRFIEDDATPTRPGSRARTRSALPLFSPSPAKVQFSRGSLLAQRSFGEAIQVTMMPFTKGSTPRTNALGFKEPDMVTTGPTRAAQLRSHANFPKSPCPLSVYRSRGPIMLLLGAELDSEDQPLDSSDEDMSDEEPTVLTYDTPKNASRDSLSKASRPRDPPSVFPTAGPSPPPCGSSEFRQTLDTLELGFNLNQDKMMSRRKNSNACIY